MRLIVGNESKLLDKQEYTQSP